MMKHVVTIGLALGAVSGPVFAGSVTGVIRFEGEAPVMRVIEMDVDPVCAAKHGEPVRAEVLVLGEGQTMANVFVQITEGRPKEEHPVPEEPVVLTQEGCRYSPHVLAVRKGQPLKVLNPDGTLHNVHGLARKNPEFNRSMPASMTELNLVFETVEEPFPLKCQVHPWMTAYLAVVDHPYVDVTATDGVYTITGLPAGTYTVQAWHERLGVQEAEVTIGEGEIGEADFTFSR